MIISEMKVVLTAATSAFAKSMDKAGGKVKGFKARASKLGAAMKGLGPQAAAAAAIVSGLAWGAKKIFDLGASIEETGSKFNTVFGPEASAEVSAFLDNFANKAGLTTNEAKGLVATAGAITQGLGFTQKASGETAIAMTKLAGDLSSFNNIPTAETMHAISSALTGEREQLKALGIVVQEADVQAKAFAMTGKTVAKNLTQQEKATATLALITEKAGSAIGDLDRTSGSAANVFKRLRARFLEIRDAIATALMPAFSNILAGIEKSEGGIQAFKQAIIDNTGVISAWAIVAIEAFKYIAELALLPLKVIKNIAEIFGNLFKMAKAIVTGDWGSVTDEIMAGWENVKDIGNAVVDVWEQAGDYVGAIANAVSGANEEFIRLENQVNTTAGAVDTTADAVENLANTTADAVNNMINKWDEIDWTAWYAGLGGAVDNLEDRLNEIDWSAFNTGLEGAMDNLKDRLHSIILPAWYTGRGDETPLEPAIEAAETLDKKLGDLSDSFSKNFVGRMTEAAQGGENAFAGYFEYMRKQLIALSMRALVFQSIMSLGKSFGIDMSKVGSFATSVTGFSPATGGGDTGTGAPGAGTPILSGRAANASPRGIIVNQNINFSVSAIDGRSAAQFIKEQGGTIAEVIATAAKDSTAYRRQLQGA